jgi:hypothetical protein
MKKSELLWCVVPLLALIFHFSVGKKLLLAENAAAVETNGYLAEVEGRFAKAEALYVKALRVAHPADFPLMARLDVAKARVDIHTGDAPAAADQLERLLAKRSTTSLPKALQTETQTVRATALYYTAFALRLLDSNPERWAAKAEEARTAFLALHQNALEHGSPETVEQLARALEAASKLLHYRDTEIAGIRRPPIAQATLERNAPARKLNLADESP